MIEEKELEVEKELEELYSLKHLIRYNNLPRINNESVAEHSFFVALIVERLSKDYNFDISKAIRMAIVHDIFEIYIGDTPRNIKDKFKKLDKELEKAEIEIVKIKFPEYHEFITEFNNKSTVEGKIVRLADSLSVLQYASTELRLGSTFYMPKVLDSAKRNIETIKKELEEYRK